MTTIANRMRFLIRNASDSFTDWWFLRRPWVSAGVYPRPPIKPEAERMLILRGSFMRVCVEVSFPWRKA